MANSKSPKVNGLALTLSILSVVAYVPSHMFLQGALGFDFGIGAVKNKVMHPFGGGDKPAAGSADAATAKDSSDDTDAGKDLPTKRSKDGAGAAKDAGAAKGCRPDQKASGLRATKTQGGQETAAPAKKQRTGRNRNPPAAEDMTKARATPPLKPRPRPEGRTSLRSTIPRLAKILPGQSAKWHRKTSRPKNSKLPSAIQN